MDNELLFAAVLAFFAAFAAVETLLNWWQSTRGSEARRFADRLAHAAGNMDAGSNAATLLKQRVRARIEATGLRGRVQSRIDRLLSESGSDWTIAQFVAFTLIGGVGAALVVLLLRLPLLVAVGIGLVAMTIPWNIQMMARYKRRVRFEYLLPDSLDLIGRALRSGHSFPSALQMAGADLPDPVGEEFKITSDEINFGIAQATALQNLVRRVPSQDLSFFVIAVLIQRETGGNLAEVLDNISRIIRERLKLFGKVRAISAEAKLSGWVLSLLPFATAGLLYMINPEFMSLLWTEKVGVYMIYTALVSTFIGILWMRKVIRIHV